MRMQRARRTIAAAPVLLVLAAACAQPPEARAFAGPGGQPAPAAGIAVSVDSAHPGTVIPSSFLGLSMETPAVDSPAVVSEAPALLRLMRQLGPGVLRISGVSVDRTQWMATPEPAAPWRVATITPADLRNLAALMGATGWRLLLGLNLGHPVSQALVEEARVATSVFGSSLAGLEIGNEPDLYTRSVSAPFRYLLGGGALRPREWGPAAYEAEITSLRAALAAGGVPAALYGPDTAAPAWLEGYVARQGPGLAALAQHFYPLGRCHAGRLLAAGPSPASLLSRKVALHEVRRIGELARLAARHGLPLRIDEANSVSCAGQPHTSDTFAAALWAVDFSLIAAHEGVIGVNFHGGLGSCSVAGTIASPWYSPLCVLTSGQLRARPEYYGLLLLRSLEGCAFLPTAYSTSRDIAIYALRATDGSLRVVIDDMEAPVAARRGKRARAPAPALIALRADRSYDHASVVRLSAPSARSAQGVRYGGAQVGEDGSFAGPVPVPLAGAPGSFRVAVRPASVAVVTLAAGAATAGSHR